MLTVFPVGATGSPFTWIASIMLTCAPASTSPKLAPVLLITTAPLVFGNKSSPARFLIWIFFSAICVSPIHS